MAQPRAFVNRNGLPTKLATGISMHKASRRFYTRDEKGQRRYFRTWDAAKAHLDGQAIAAEPPVPLATASGWFDGPPRDQLPLDGTPLDEVADDHPHRAYLEAETDGRPHVTIRDVAADEFWAAIRRRLETDPTAFADRLGVSLTKPSAAKSVALKTIGERWREHAEQRHGGATRHTAEMVERWTAFVRRAGNLPVGELTPETFRVYHAHLEVAGRGKSAKWITDRAATVVSILRWATRKYPEWAIPANALVWADSYDRRKYKPAADNRRPITPDELAALIAVCRRWQAIDADSMSVASDADGGRKRQAMIQRRAGYQLEAILKLAINAALDNVDIERLTWAHLKLDAAIPHLDFPRRKVEHLIGQPIARLTPLAAATIDALKRWAEFEGRASGRVFASASGSALNRTLLSRLFKSAKEAAGISGGLTFKHLRNAAPTIAHKRFNSRDLADLILGHQLPTTARFYVGDMDGPEPLIELVKVIGEVYDVH